MGKRAPTVETACPHCGRTGIPADAQRCPGCMRTLRQVDGGPVRHNDREVAPELELRTGTRLGGLDVLSSDAEARPGTVAAALGLLGLHATLAGLQRVPLPGDARGYLALGLGSVGLALLLWRLPALARPLVIVSTPVQLGAWLWLGRGALASVATLGPALAPLLVFAGVTGATGPRRRSLVLAAVVAAVCFAATYRLAERGLPGPTIDAPALGMRLLLPGGFEPVPDLERLGRWLPLSKLSASDAAVGFEDPVRGAGALWMIAGRTPPETAAAQLASDLPAAGAVVRSHDALPGLPVAGQAAYRVPLPAGRLASVCAARLADDRTVVLVVGAPDEGLDEARARLAEGAEFRPVRSRVEPADRR